MMSTLRTTKAQKEALQLAADGGLMRIKKSWVHKSGRRFRNYWTIERLVRHRLLRSHMYAIYSYLT